MCEKDPAGKDVHESGAKLDAGKPRCDMVLSGFSRALVEVVKVGTYGAAKYTDFGWISVHNGQQRYSDAMLRHYFSESMDGVVDPETDLLHAAQVAWNALARLERSN